MLNRTCETLQRRRPAEILCGGAGCRPPRRPASSASSETPAHPKTRILAHWTVLPATVFAALAALPAGAQTEAWQEGLASGPLASYRSADGVLQVAVRCRSSGYVDRVFTIQGDLDLTPSPRGDGRMISVDMSFRAKEGPGGSEGGDLGAVRQLPGAIELVTAANANEMPRWAAEDWKPERFEVKAGGRRFTVPFMPPALAARIERRCDFRWYDYILGFFGMLFYAGR